MEFRVIFLSEMPKAEDEENKKPWNIFDWNNLSTALSMKTLNYSLERTPQPPPPAVC